MKIHSPDPILISTIFIILIFGLIMLSSAGVVVSFEKFGDANYLIKHQIFFGLIPGLILLFFTSRIDYRLWQKFALPLLIFSIIFLILVFIPGLGQSYGRAKSWINVFGVSVQPSEIVKLVFILYLSAWLSKRGKEVPHFFYGFLPFLIFLSLISFLIALQPDIGTMSIIVLIALIIYFAAGAKVWHLGLVGLGGLSIIFVLIKIAPYRLARFLVFLNPELDPQGIGYHLKQAFLAIGSGGLFGRGLGFSRQKYLYLPEVTGDSIFAIIAEELGFIFTVLLVILFLILMFRGLRLARLAPDNFSRLTVVGIISWFIFQAMINIGAMVGLLPLTGLPLPFISYGGTALAVSLAAVGILINISRQSREFEKVSR
jgi:cell division protein FtsW